MNGCKKLITKIGIATAIIAVSLSTTPAKADISVKKCTHDPLNNRVSCHTKKQRTTRTVTGNTTTTLRSSFNTEMNLSGSDVENIINDLLVPKKRNSSGFNRHRRHQIPSINF